MKKDEPRPTDAPREAAGSGDGTDPSQVTPEEPESRDDEEMGGEAPCQLHRFWDVDE